MNLPDLTATIISLFLLPLPFARAVSFEIERFDANTTDIIYEGDAEAVDGVLELTNRVKYIGRVGRATYGRRIPTWDSHNKKLTDFDTHFTFMIDKKGQGTYGSGFAFYLAPWGYQIPPNSGGGFLGLFNKSTTNSPRDQVVLVELDYYIDDEWDPPFQHVGINSDSISSVVHTPWNVNLHDGKITDVWINYNATTTNLTVRWSYRDDAADLKGEPTSLSHIIDLTKYLPQWVSIGFSASTSQYGERHNILSWKFGSSLDGIPDGRNVVKRAKSSKLVEEISVVASILLAVVIGVYIAKPVEEMCNQFKNLINRPTHISAVLEAETTNLSIHEVAGSIRVPDPDAVIARDSSFNVGSGNYLDMDIVAMEKPPTNSGQGSRPPITEENR